MARDLPDVDADVPRLERALVNLVTNALKYSEHGAAVVVYVEQTERDVVFTVRDNGHGIAPHDLPQVFEKYRRARVTSDRDGLGLGLYIARRIVEAHGGRIWAESVLGSGSSFHIALPFAGSVGG